ncbi:hypothetical protein HOP50_05g38070 [Chloropicon primus]|uniref:Uncharacterized protein n=1 Tax=Chloropicon primus TaxID=1764295 RepID=A0A5B8MKX8_9CHLO|nr:hypothetical protein A3770_05p37960 [Chloropicon primus]UPR00492.1 hypothetical protein HOP50_05g38070 [Chloropicon primus]|mmetsp:Transcript_429/g.1217  ORF Transcript_429/g.1217 Transcript_429/m.1217 type:complete len:145 (-) Transcript_429:895-1329(-)|eukprot:QDZ21278.1 hypothetical protein A3770_05p37960 [Chloropicon primus]
MRGRDYSEPSVTIKNPFLSREEAEYGGEDRVAVCEAHVYAEEPEGPTDSCARPRRNPSWWTPFGVVNRTKSGNGFLSRKCTAADDCGGCAFDIEDGPGSQKGCCSLTCCLSEQPRLLTCCAITKCLIVILGITAVALYFLRYRR